MILKYRQPLEELIELCGLIGEVQCNIGVRDVFQIKPLWLNLSKLSQTSAQATSRALGKYAHFAWFFGSCRFAFHVVHDTRAVVI